MSEETSLPKGPLAGVTRAWDYRGGWVRAPKEEIIFNDRLTMQARLLWLWLASVHPSSTNIRWADCEEALSCGTKSRRNCLSQLVEEEFITVRRDGVVVMHDPYKAFKKDRKELIPRVEKQFYFQDEQTIEMPVLTNPEKKAPEKIDYMKICQDSWNENKPKSYAGVKKMTLKQEEAVLAHLKNLNLAKNGIHEFIKAVCEGIQKDDFWLNKNSSKTFSTIFGYGKTLDKKLRNVETLYFLGIDTYEDEATAYISSENRDLIKTYEEYSFRLDKAKLSGNPKEIKKWTDYLTDVDNKLKEAGISVEPT